MTTAVPQKKRTGLLVLAWAWVGIPFAYGVVELVLKVTKLFAN